MTDAWRDISTAPKDGTWFAICRNGEPDSIEVGCYDPYYSYQFLETSPGSGFYTKEQYRIDEWRGLNNMHRATHWMPLPSPPQVKP